MPGQTWKEFNCYEALSVASTATPAEIRAAYREASRRAHPDRGGSHDAMVRVNLAFEVLSDAAQRYAHDVHWLRAPQQPILYRTGKLDTVWDRTHFASDRLGDGRAATGFARSVLARIEQVRVRLDDELAYRQTALERDALRRLRRIRVESGLSLAGAVAAGTIATQFPFVWPVAAGMLWPFARRVGALHPRAGRRARADAAERARQSCLHDGADLDIYRDILAGLAELVLTPTATSDNEDRVAQRLAAALFVYGWIPERFDAYARFLVLTRGKQRALARFRHRVGPALNRQFLDKTLRLAGNIGADQTFIFCTPGFSKRAVDEAQRVGIQTFDLDQLNAWAPRLWHEEGGGPSGDLLAHLLRLRQFLRTLSSL
jgi:hypothetical protein